MPCALRPTRAASNSAGPRRLVVCSVPGALSGRRRPASWRMNQMSYAACQSAMLTCDAKLPGIGLAIERPARQNGPLQTVGEPYQHVGGILGRQQLLNVLVAQ